MTSAVGVRLPDDILKKAEYLGKFASEDRSIIIRRAVTLRLRALLEKKAAEGYAEGRISLSEDARKTEVTIWEMEKYLVDKEFKSNYSVEDLAKELRLLK